MNFTSGIGGMNVERDEFAHSNFNLFENTEYEVGVKKLVSQIFRPLSTPNTTGQFSFRISRDPDKFTNVKSLRLHGKMHIKKKDLVTQVLSSLTNEYVSPINIIFNS